MKWKMSACQGSTYIAKALGHDVASGSIICTKHRHNKYPLVPAMYELDIRLLGYRKGNDKANGVPSGPNAVTVLLIIAKLLRVS
jgi:hypothetical protein